MSLRLHLFADGLGLVAISIYLVVNWPSTWMTGSAVAAGGLALMTVMAVSIRREKKKGR